MDFSSIPTFIFGTIASVAALLYIEEWYRKKYREGKMNTAQIPQSGTPSKWSKIRENLPLIIVFCCILYTISGAFWLHGKLVGSKQPDNNTYKDLSPTNTIVIERQSFRNERVYLDGKNYRDCQFYFVTFVYEGKRPFYFSHNSVVGPFMIDPPPQFYPLLEFLHEAGTINTNLVRFYKKEGDNIQPLP